MATKTIDQILHDKHLRDDLFREMDGNITFVSLAGWIYCAPARTSACGLSRIRLRQISGGVGKTVRKRRNGGRAGGGAPIGADRTAPEP